MQEPLPVTPLTPAFQPNDALSLGAIDYSQPVSTLLRTSIKRGHDAVHHSELAGKLMGGELPRGGYVYLMMLLWRIYSILEDGLERHETNPVLAPSYRPALFGRVGPLSADIAYLLDTTEDEWCSNPLFLSLMSAPPEGVRDYVAHLEKLITSENPTDHARLLAHAYARYMGDVSRGQGVRKTVAKVYELPDEGAGASFYDFASLHGSVDAGDKQAIKADRLKTMDWYRQGMDEGVGDDKEMKEVILLEVNLAFEFNRRLFQDVLTATKNTQLSQFIPKSKGVFDASEEPRKKTYLAASIMAIVITLATTHFILVVGGFTGGEVQIH